MEQRVRLSKITLIYGPNSSGKSSILQSLLMLKQSIFDTGDSTTNWRLVTNGGLVDLGSHSALIHRHEKDRRLGLSVRFLRRPSLADTEVSMTFDGPGELGLQGQRYSAILSEAAYVIGLGRDTLAQARLAFDKLWWRSEISILGVDFPEVLVEGEQYSRRQFLPKVKFPPQDVSQDGETESWRRREQSQVVWEREQRQATEAEDELRKARQKLQRELEKIPISLANELRSIRYLGPLRSYPERLYRASDAGSNFSGERGEFAHLRLYHQPALKEEVNRWFRTFKINLELETQPVGDVSMTGEHIALVVLDRDTGTPVTLKDVGFGVNQILPVVIEGVDFLSDTRARILCIEQPEIHIHPRLQTHLADLMIETTAGAERRNKQWIVETHSEMIALRLLRRIRENKLSPDDVSVVYVKNDPNGNGSTVQSLRIDEEGDFVDTWPDGFFNEGFDELTMGIGEEE